MITALGFLAIAGAFMLAGQFALRHAQWPSRAPRLAIALWQALAGGVVISLLLACMSLTLPGVSAVGTLGEVIHACFVELKRQYSTPVGAAVSTLGIVLFLLLSVRLGVAFARRRRAVTRSRRGHLNSLALIAERTEGGVLSVDHDAVAVYCVPAARRSRAGTVVVTRGAREILTEDQLQLVLSHELAHLRSRHDRLVGRSRALSDALPWLPFFATAHNEISNLVEMHADDAVDDEERGKLAVALYRLASATRSHKPLGSLAATGGTTTARVQRLVLPKTPLRRVSTGLVIAAIIGIGATPAALAIFPSSGDFLHACCAWLSSGF